MYLFLILIVIVVMIALLRINNLPGGQLDEEKKTRSATDNTWFSFGRDISDSGSFDGGGGFDGGSLDGGGSDGGGGFDGGSSDGGGGDSSSF